ncbi:putative TIR domain, P-loop containing nucleoside triphosphate hydrolase [Helianthus annuus]|nr:putative TIR domain, P-loop containing nucleoside triphosphate hydrolase [Helianthus annuus]
MSTVVFCFDEYSFFCYYKNVRFQGPGQINHAKLYRRSRRMTASHMSTQANIKPTQTSVFSRRHPVTLYYLVFAPQIPNTSMSSSWSSTHSVPTSSSQSCKYDIFLSFRGEDTRKTFVDHLYAAFKQHLISIYKDDETLPRGESIRLSLFKAIEESRIAVIIFSKNYTNSSWCMEELAHIMKCKNEKELIVMPIFYGVDPSELRKQNRDLGKAFAKQEVENINEAELQRNALLFDAVNIAGWEPAHIAGGHESKVINEIVDTILDALSPLNLEAKDDLVGMTSRLQDLESRLEIGSDGVRMVGIWGVGGGGKTTLVSSLCMKISCYFEGHHIIENIREESNKYGLKRLQEDILSAFSKKKVKVYSIVRGKSKIKGMLCRRNVLLILDDVDNLDQLDALAGSHTWFGNGSRIIITTRDEHLLRTHKVNEVCPVTLLSYEEAIQLFNRHARNEKFPVQDYETLSLRVVSYAAGLPLALKVLGSFLYDKDENEWISALEKLNDIPELRVMDILKISYDGLETYQKELFLDIACLYRRWIINDAIEKLEACGYHPRIGIKVLRQKALITTVDGYFDMHDLIQEMGHYIVRGEYPNNPEKHSRVWKHEEIKNMCLAGATKMKENHKIEAIEYYGHDHSSQFSKIISDMKKLRQLSVSLFNSDENTKGPNFLSNELRYIYWSKYPASPFPCSFQPVKLVVLKLSFSMQKEVWKGYKHLPHLKVLQLCHMKKLLSTPNFDGLPCLRKLTLHDCDELEEIHQSLGNHTSLEYISVSRCHKLRMFPKITHLEKLEALEIEECHKLFEFPEILANMESLVKLSFIEIGIEVMPSSIGKRCTNLISLYLFYLRNIKSIQLNLNELKHLKEFKLRGLKQLEKRGWLVLHQYPNSLRELDLSACCLVDREIPSDIAELYNLQELNLSWNDFSRLDFSLSKLACLKLLNVSHCVLLIELPELPPGLTILKADDCISLTTIGDLPTNCKRLCQVSLTGGSFMVDSNKLLQSMLEGKAFENHTIILQLEGLKVPRWFTPRLLKGSRCRLELPDNWWNDFSGFLMCTVLTSNYLSDFLMIRMKHTMSGTSDFQHDVVWEESSGDKYTLVWCVPFGSLINTIWWDQTYKVVEFHIQDDCCGGFGVRLIDNNTCGLSDSSTKSSSIYTPHIEIQHDSATALTIYLNFYDQ